MRSHITIRPLQVADAKVMADVLADQVLYTFTGGRPPSEQELRDRYTIQTQGQSPDGSAIWVNRIVTLGIGGPAIGYVQATVPVLTGPAEIAWVIGRQWQGHGYASAAVRLLIEELCDRGVPEVIANIHPTHIASIRVAQTVGMSPTTKTCNGEVAWAMIVA